MADLNAILPGNVAGDLFVDDTCIDCDLCRQIAPESFAPEGGYSVVYRQPETPEQIHDARKALLTCPTGSIGTRQKPDLGEAFRAYRFEWILPGHGRRAHYPPAVMRDKVAECVEWMRRVA